MHRQTCDYLENVFLKFQCGLWKGYITEDCLDHGKNLQKSNDEEKEHDALFTTDFSKA